MIRFQQTVASFRVEEELFYEPEGQGSYTFLKICKKGLSTLTAKRRIFECSGVPLKQIRHAGMKDTRATAIQWLSWPAKFEEHPFQEPEDIEILVRTKHTNNLSIGHVKANRFQITLEADLNEPDPVSTRFPNFYGAQRFGRSELNKDLVLQAIKKPSKSKTMISMYQAWLFNRFLQARWVRSGFAPFPDDIWTNSNGKRWFQAELNDALQERLRLGDVVPTGPIYGYKTLLTEAEQDLFGGLNPEVFRAWGKIAKGARRPLFAKAELHAVRTTDQHCKILDFSLPSGAYATVFLTFLYKPELLSLPETEWVNYTEHVVLA